MSNSEKKVLYQAKSVLQNVNVLVTATKTKQGKIRLNGKLRDATTGAVLDKGSGTAGSAEEAPVYAEALAMRLVRKQLEKQASRSQAAETDDSIYTKLFCKLSEEEKLELTPATWGETTRRQGLKYFELTMLPLLDFYGDSLTQADADDILERIRLKAFQNTRRGESESVTETKVRQHAVDFNRIYPAFRLVVGEGMLPELRLPIPYRQKTIRSEHTKALPLAVQVQQIALFVRLISNGLTMGAVLMKLGGLRTGEVCGLNFEDVEIHEDYAVVWVLRQVQKKKLSDNLKRDDSYRPVILPRLAVDLLLMRIEFLESIGYPQWIGKYVKADYTPH